MGDISDDRWTCPDPRCGRTVTVGSGKDDVIRRVLTEAQEMHRLSHEREEHPR